jgi:hypothetical protein
LLRWLRRIEQSGHFRPKSAENQLRPLHADSRPATRRREVHTESPWLAREPHRKDLNLLQERRAGGLCFVGWSDNVALEDGDSTDLHPSRGRKPQVLSADLSSSLSYGESLQNSPPPSRESFYRGNGRSCRRRDNHRGRRSQQRVCFWGSLRGQRPSPDSVRSGHHLGIPAEADGHNSFCLQHIIPGDEPVAPTTG